MNWKARRPRPFLRPALRPAVRPASRALPAILLSILAAVCPVLAGHRPAHALETGAIPYQGYQYSTDQATILSAPPAYLPDRTLDGVSLGVGALSSPSDLFLDEAEDLLAIADTGNNRVVLAWLSTGETEVLSTFDNDGLEDTLSAPSGVCIAEDGTLYVADTGNGRILSFDRSLALVREYGRPDTTLIGEKTEYKPLRVAVDRAGTLYVVGENLIEGIVEMTGDGTFTGFVGTNLVSPNLWELFWRAVATRRQREAMGLFVPVNFRSLDLAGDGFLMAVSQIENNLSGSAVKRLNPGGIDVIRTRTLPLIGDQGPLWVGSESGYSVFFDVAAAKDGIFYTVDNKRGRVFGYDQDGNLLFVFGQNGSQAGTFRSAVALDTRGDDVLVLDAGTALIQVFEPTVYGRLILDAVTSQQGSDFGQAAETWTQVRALNANLELAHVGIGKALMRERRYREAMASFLLGRDREGYSKAFKLHRRQVVSRIFPWFASAAAILVLLAVLLANRRRRRGAVPAGPGKADISLPGALDHAFRILVHPFRGFAELKHERRNRTTLAAAGILLLGFLAVQVLRIMMTGFLFNPVDIRHVNLALEVAKVVMTLLLWCVANWCLTSLMEGEGTFRDIVVFTAYALVPMVLFRIPLLMLSHVLILEEGAFYIVLDVLAQVWTGFLLLAGCLETHGFTLKKTVANMVLTLVGIVFLVFIGYLVLSLSGEVLTFVRTIYREILFRL